MFLGESSSLKTRTKGRNTLSGGQQNKGKGETKGSQQPSGDD